MTFDEISNIMASSGASNWQTFTKGSGPSSTAFYKNDVLLRVEMSFSEENEHNSDFKEPWANKFPDSKALSYYANLYYGSTKIGYYILVSVDGGRALLPLPARANFIVKQESYLVASLFDDGKSLDDYMGRAGLRLNSDTENQSET